MENEDESLDCGLRYRKAIEDYKDIENDFYSNDSPNDDLENKF